MRKLTYEKVYEEIRRRIKEGDWKPGDQIPTVQQLSEEMKVGVSSIREAVRVLEMQKILSVEQGRGTFVRSGFDKPPAEALIELENATFRQLTETRWLLEPELAAHAALNATADQANAIMTHAMNMLEKMRKDQDFFEEDMAFHEKIAVAANHDIMLHLMNILNDLLVDSRRKSMKFNFGEAAASYHILIAKAIQEKNPEKARMFMRMHLEELETEFNKYATE